LHFYSCFWFRTSPEIYWRRFKNGKGALCDGKVTKLLFVADEKREHAPSIIFMDEIDSIGSTRLESGGGGDSEVQRTMLELLNQLDGFESTKNIKV
jgi:ATP-dependent 26S proteasome regulatory subunit